MGYAIQRNTQYGKPCANDAMIKMQKTIIDTVGVVLRYAPNGIILPISINGVKKVGLRMV